MFIIRCFNWIKGRLWLLTTWFIPFYSSFSWFIFVLKGEKSCKRFKRNQHYLRGCQRSAWPWPLTPKSNTFQDRTVFLRYRENRQFMDDQAGDRTPSSRPPSWPPSWPPSPSPREQSILLMTKWLKSFLICARITCISEEKRDVF